MRRRKGRKMTLDEAIKHCEEVAESCERGNPKKRSKSKCASEHRQLAEWLTELKDLREENKALMQECDRLIKEKGELLSKVSGGDVLRICQLEEQLKDWKEEYANLNKISYSYYKELKEAKQLLKSAIDEWHIVCEWGNCGEYCGWFENGKCSQEWSGEAEAFALIGDERNEP
jgi:DNA repair exonuclease SbcCD ATPase subunit